MLETSQRVEAGTGRTGGESVVWGTGGVKDGQGAAWCSGYVGSPGGLTTSLKSHSYPYSDPGGCHALMVTGWRDLGRTSRRIYPGLGIVAQTGTARFEGKAWNPPLRLPLPGRP